MKIPFFFALLCALLLSSGVALAEDLKLEESPEACSLAGTDVSSVVGVNDLGGVKLLVEDANPLGAMPTYFLHVVFPIEPDNEDKGCFFLKDGKEIAKYHLVNLKDAKVLSEDDKSAVVQVEVTKDFNTSEIPETSELKIEIDKVNRTAKLK